MKKKNSTYIIAEVAQAHEGSLGAAHAFIEEASKVGIDAIKFQAHYAKYESTRDEKFRIQMSGQDESRYDYWKRMEFTPDQWRSLLKHCEEKSIDFVCSPFSEYAVDLLSSIGQTIWKIGSGEIIDKALLNRILMKKCDHIYISCGMLLKNEIEELTRFMQSKKRNWTLMHCTSLYPAPIDKIGINIIDEWTSKYNVNVGYSDHSSNLNVAMAAIAKEIDAYEGHIVFDKRQYGPDTSSSLTLDDFKKLVVFRDTIDELRIHPVDKDQLDDKILVNRRLFTKSLALKADLKKGTCIEKGMLTIKKPGGGISPEDINSVVGKRIKKDWTHDRILHWELFE